MKRILIILSSSVYSYREIITVSAFAAFLSGSAQAAKPVVYDCKWGAEEARLNFTTHIATYAGKDVDMKEGIVFGFDDPAGKYVLFDIPIAIDEILDKRPRTMSGVIRPDGDFEDPNTIPVRCTLAR